MDTDQFRSADQVLEQVWGKDQSYILQNLIKKNEKHMLHLFVFPRSLLRNHHPVLQHLPLGFLNRSAQNLPVVSGLDLYMRKNLHSRKEQCGEEKRRNSYKKLASVTVLLNVIPNQHE